ncbi:hypothetical protein AVEN_663-1 [Araneus ventricosus]|uniref:Uncharacterized protein n=1 Tax=Araneus ventricosus TaxID=182803 RepID=A0A4Y2BUE8_ARAVE|nr:hypothetical protein AVEN_663-1 [Araneus ventricosus]
MCMIRLINLKDREVSTIETCENYKARTILRDERFANIWSAGTDEACGSTREFRELLAMNKILSANRKRFVVRVGKSSSVVRRFPRTSFELARSNLSRIPRRFQSYWLTDKR